MSFWVLAGGIFVVVFIVWLFLLYGINWLYGIQKNSLRHTLYIYLLAMVGVFVAGIVVGALSIPSPIGELAGLVGGTYAAYWGYKKFFNVSGIQFAKAWATFLVASFLLQLTVLPIRLHVVEPYVIEGNSMAPAYKDDDYLLLNKWSDDIEAGDAVVARFSCEEGPCAILRRVNTVAGSGYELVSDDGVDLFTGTVVRENIIGKVWFNLGTFPFAE